MEEDITGTGQIPTEERRKVIRVSSRVGLSGETTSKDTESGEFFYTFKMMSVYRASRVFIKPDSNTVSFPFSADCSRRAVCQVHIATLGDRSTGLLDLCLLSHSFSF